MTCLPRPSLRRGDATDQALAIARFATELELDLERFHPHAPVEIWAGVAADRQRAAADIAVAAGRSIVTELRRALTPLMTLEHALDAALAELDRLQRELDDANAWAESSLSAATLGLASAESAQGAADEAQDTETRCLQQADAICAEFDAVDLRTALCLDATLGGDAPLARSQIRVAPPRTTGRALDGLQPRDASTLARLVPGTLATLRSAPLGLRYEANRVRVREYVSRLRDQRAVIASIPAARRVGAEQRRIAWIDRQLSINEGLLRPGRNLLAWDPRGDGLVIEVLGDATTARHIAVVVPGITNTIGNFDQRLRERSSNIFESAAGLDPDVAVIAWLGYDTPGVIGSLSGQRALDASSNLGSFIDSLPTGRHISLVAHSYGTVVAGFAARTRLAVDELVLVGSPGTPLDHARQSRLQPHGRVWSATSDSDLVGRFGPGTDRCPEVLIGASVTGPRPALWPGCRLDSDGDVFELVHGRNPSHEGFGAIEIDTTGVTGHSDYFDPGTTSLDAIARIVVGRPGSGG